MRNMMFVAVLAFGLGLVGPVLAQYPTTTPAVTPVSPPVVVQPQGAASAAAGCPALVAENASLQRKVDALTAKVDALQLEVTAANKKLDSLVEWLGPKTFSTGRR